MHFLALFASAAPLYVFFPLYPCAQVAPAAEQFRSKGPSWNSFFFSGPQLASSEHFFLVRSADFPSGGLLERFGEFSFSFSSLVIFFFLFILDLSRFSTPLWMFFIRLILIDWSLEVPGPMTLPSSSYGFFFRTILVDQQVSFFLSPVLCPASLSGLFPPPRIPVSFPVLHDPLFRPRTRT